MARRPSFQFYPGDYAANTNLRRCTHEEKGVNMDFLCLAHDSDEYGIVRWPLKELAQAIGCKASILVALVNKNVIKGADEGTMCDVFVFTPCHAGQRGLPVELIPEQPGPLWYSSRMVRDEYVRQNRGKASRFISEGGQPPDDSPNPSPMPPPMPPFGDGSSSSSSSSSSSFNPLLRSDSAPSQGGENHGSNPDPVLLALLWFAKVADARRQVESLDRSKVVQAAFALADRGDEVWPEVFLNSVTVTLPGNTAVEITARYQKAVAGEQVAILEQAEDALAEVKTIIGCAELSLSVAFNRVGLGSDWKQVRTADIVKAWPQATKASFIAANGEEAYTALLQGRLGLEAALGLFRPGLVKEN